MSGRGWITEFAKLHPLLRTSDADAVAEFEDEVIAPMREIAHLLADSDSDFLVNDLGDGLTAIIPITEDAVAWFEKHVGYGESQRYDGIGVVMHSRYAVELIEIIRTGTPFTVGEAG